MFVIFGFSTSNFFNVSAGRLTILGLGDGSSGGEIDDENDGGGGGSSGGEVDDENDGGGGGGSIGFLMLLWGSSLLYLRQLKLDVL